MNYIFLGKFLYKIRIKNIVQNHCVTMIKIN